MPAPDFWLSYDVLCHLQIVRWLLYIVQQNDVCLIHILLHNFNPNRSLEFSQYFAAMAIYNKPVVSHVLMLITGI